MDDGLENENEKENEYDLWDRSLLTKEKDKEERERVGGLPP